MAQEMTEWEQRVHGQIDQMLEWVREERATVAELTEEVFQYKASLIADTLPNNRRSPTTVIVAEAHLLGWDLLVDEIEASASEEEIDEVVDRYRRILTSEGGR